MPWRSPEVTVMPHDGLNVFQNMKGYKPIILLFHICSKLKNVHSQVILEQLDKSIRFIAFMIKATRPVDKNGFVYKITVRQKQFNAAMSCAI